MEKEYGESELKNMEYLISDYISASECDNNMNCIHCEDITDCYYKANDRCNSDFAESVNYGGCNSENEFWEQLFD